jgi:hypothetical protein
VRGAVLKNSSEHPEAAVFYPPTDPYSTDKTPERADAANADK